MACLDRLLGIMDHEPLPRRLLEGSVATLSRINHEKVIANFEELLRHCSTDEAYNDVLDRSAAMLVLGTILWKNEINVVPWSRQYGRIIQTPIEYEYNRVGSEEMGWHDADARWEVLRTFFDYFPRYAENRVMAEHRARNERNRVALRDERTRHALRDLIGTAAATDLPGVVASLNDAPGGFATRVQDQTFHIFTTTTTNPDPQVQQAGVVLDEHALDLPDPYRWRRFELNGRFWEIRQIEAANTFVRFGRIGSQGQCRRVSRFPQSASQRIRDRIRAGWVEVERG